MNRSEEVFQIGDRVAYSGFNEPEYGTVTAVTIVVSKTTQDDVEVRMYIIEMDGGGMARTHSSDFVLQDAQPSIRH